MKIFITGIGGAIGSHVAEAFSRDGHTVVGIDNLDPYYDPAIKRLTLKDIAQSKMRVGIADLVTDNLATHISPDTDMIFHFAAQPGLSSGTSFEHYVRNNITATEKLLSHARTLPKLKAFVYISTSSVYGKSARGAEDSLPRPTSGYGVTKLAAEQLALSRYRTEGLPVISLRLFSVYGPRERPEKFYHKLTHSILTGKPFTLHDGSFSHMRSYTYVGDVVEAMRRVVEMYKSAIGEIINIGSADMRSTEEGFRAIESIIGRSAEIVVVPPRPGDQLETEAVIRKAKTILGFSPHVSLEEGLAEQVKWHRERLLPRL